MICQAIAYQNSLLRHGIEFATFFRSGKKNDRKTIHQANHRNGLYRHRRASGRGMKATASQRRIWGKLANIGCIACRKDGYDSTPGEIHHIKVYGYHNHDLVLCLCFNHHNNLNKLVPCIHHNPLQFVERYGSELELLAESLDLIGVKIRKDIKNEKKYHPNRTKKDCQL